MTDAYQLIRGVSPVLATPFESDGAVDVGSFRRSVATLVEAGVTSVMVPGFASEFYALDDVERAQLVAETLGVTSGADVAVIGSVSDNSTVVALRRALDLVDKGVHALNILPPRFLSVPTPATLEHLDAVASAVPEVPVVVQYVPDGAGSSLTAADMQSLASANANVRLVKAELKHPADYIATLRGGEPRIESLIGNGGIELVPALEAGAVGVQPGGGFVEVYIAIWRLWEAGEKTAAIDVFRRLLPYLSTWTSAGVLTQVGKIIAHRRGEFTTPLCRAPLVPVGAYAASLIDPFLAEFAPELAG